MTPLLAPTEDGLYCEAGGFHVDPWRPVDRAVITHAHSDHARWGCERYLTTPHGAEVLRKRVQSGARLDTLNYGEPTRIGDVTVSLHPAGHVLGSAQVRIEHHGEVWVVSGDYKVHRDVTCRAFEPVPCHTYITEATFALPVYRWPAEATVFEQINAWWRANQAADRASVLLGYALGKAQRLIAGVDAGIGPILVHGAVAKFVEVYREAGVAMPEVLPADAERAKAHRGRALVVAPPSAAGSPWLRKFGEVSLAMASGWMQIRGARRRRAIDRGFVLSDHADWPGLLHAIEETGAEQIGVTHGFTSVLSRYLNESGRSAAVLPTRYEGEVDDGGEDEG